MCRGGGKATTRSYAARDVDFSISAFRTDPYGNGLKYDQDIPVGGSDMFAWLWAKVLGEHRL